MATRVRKQLPIPELDGQPGDDRIWCAWADCDNPASGLHKGVECYANPRVSGHSEHPRRPMCSECRWVAFCSAGHMDFYFRSHRPGEYGMHSAGVNGRYM